MEYYVYFQDGTFISLFFRFACQAVIGDLAAYLEAQLQSQFERTRIFLPASPYGCKIVQKAIIDQGLTGKNRVSLAPKGSG